MAKPSGLEGYLVIDKPAGMTSHDVVAHLRRRLGERRIGHAGTLDPDATGVLVVAVGFATRLLSVVLDLEKTYEGSVTFGARTSTLDASGEVLETFPIDALSAHDVQAAAALLTGDIEQVPPMVSALKVGGTRLYELERRGLTVERAPRRVHVAEFQLTPTNERAVYSFVVRCSSGTYVRSLCDDLGRALGGGAYLSRLRRSAVGAFDLSQALALETAGPADLRPAIGLVAHLPQVRVQTAEICSAVLDGKVLDGALFDLDGERAAGRGPIAVCDQAGDLLALYASQGTGRYKPTLVLASAQRKAREAPGAAPGAGAARQ